MRTKNIAAISTIAASILSSPAHAVEPRQPTGAWTVDFGESYCYAMLPYSDSRDKDVLLVKALPSRHHTQLTYVREGWARSLVSADGTLRIDGSEVPAQLLRHGSKKQEVNRFMVAAPISALKDASRIEMELPGDDIDLVVPHMDQVATAMSTCVEDLRKHWNVGVHTEGSTGPVGEVRTLLTANDFPKQAIKNGEGATARAMLLIDTHGKVADCSMLVFFGDALLAGQTCALLSQRVEMEPARDPKGEPVRAYYVTPPIRWQVGSKRKMQDLLDKMAAWEAANGHHTPDAPAEDAADESADSE